MRPRNELQKGCSGESLGAGLPVSVRGGEGNRNPTFGEDTCYPPVVVVLALVRRNFQAKPDGTPSAHRFLHERGDLRLNGLGPL